MGLETQPGGEKADDISRLLRAWSDGDQDALKSLTPIVYSELHNLARRYLRRERGGHSLQTSALTRRMKKTLLILSNKQNKKNFRT